MCCPWYQGGMCVGKWPCAVLLSSLCKELRCWDFIFYLAEMQNCWINPPVRLIITPFLCTRGHREDLTSVLSYTHCGTLQPLCLLWTCCPVCKGEVELWSESSPTSVTFSCVQVSASVCKKDVRCQRCPGLLLTWVVASTGVNSPLAPSSQWCLPKYIPNAGQENLSVEEHSSSKGDHHCSALSRSQTSSVVLNASNFTLREQSVTSLMCFEITFLGFSSYKK